MSGMKDAFYGDRPAPGHYPSQPGWKAEGTSQEAASAMEKTAGNLRDLVLAALEAAGPTGLTADDVAAKLNKSVLAIRPRLTELGPKHFDKIERTGERRKNQSGLKASVWRAKQ
jgi:hypothetical protein